MSDLIFLSHFFTSSQEFLYSLERKKPEVFKTHPTFVFRPLLVVVMNHLNEDHSFFWDTLYILHLCELEIFTNTNLITDMITKIK